MILERSIYSNAVQGLVLSMVFAFLVLIVSTHNIIVATLNVITIGGVLASVTGMIYMWGW